MKGELIKRFLAMPDRCRPYDSRSNGLTSTVNRGPQTDCSGAYILLVECDIDLYQCSTLNPFPLIMLVGIYLRNCTINHHWNYFTGTPYMPITDTTAIATKHRVQLRNNVVPNNATKMNVTKTENTSTGERSSK